MPTPAIPVSDAPVRFVLNPSKVQDSLAVLRQLGAHRTLPGYLCLQHTAAREQRLEDLHPPFKEFFEEFLTVPDALPQRPFLNPFEASDGKVWSNPNVAGSYSPGSLRGASPLLRVLTLEDGAYHLRPQHWQLAREALLNGRQLPVLALATFLYRDRGITHPAPTPQQLVRAFQGEFGYLDEAGQITEAYRSLYADYEPEDADSTTWFLPADTPALLTP